MPANSQTKPKHTPLSEWSLRPCTNGGKVLIRGDGLCNQIIPAEDADFILLACNSHYELLEACKAAGGMLGHHHWDNTMQRGVGCILCQKQHRIWEQIEAAIAKANGKETNV